MTTGRAHISMQTKLASALLKLADVPYEHAKLMSPQQIISLYQFHHNILHSTVPVDEFWNLEPLLIGEHRGRFQQDAAVAAKIKRLRGEKKARPKKLWPKRKIQSRGFSRIAS
jgi:hypothetical protein